jgi:hypothetical protein
MQIISVKIGHFVKTVPAVRYLQKKSSAEVSDLYRTSSVTLLVVVLGMVVATTGPLFSFGRHLLVG